MATPLRQRLGPEAHALLTLLDESRDFDRLMDFVSYYFLDSSQYPNLAEFLRAQGIEPREPLAMPYRCKT